MVCNMRTSLEEIKHKVLTVLKRHDITRASVFGSFARGEVEKDSDLDILIEFNGEKSLLDLVALKLELEETLRRSLDVLTYKAIHPAIREKVLKEQVTIIP